MDLFSILGQDDEFGKDIHLALALLSSLFVYKVRFALKNEPIAIFVNLAKECAQLVHSLLAQELFHLIVGLLDNTFNSFVRFLQLVIVRMVFVGVLDKLC